MVPLEFWEMGAVFVFTGIVILLMGIALGLLVATAFSPSRRKQKKPAHRLEKDDPCDTCPRWYECNGVDEECPRK